MLKTTLRLFVITGFGASVAFAAFVGLPRETPNVGIASIGSQDQEEDAKIVKLDDVPAAARAVIKTTAGSNRITEVRSESVFGATVYEAVWKLGEMEHEVVVAANGTILEHEEVIAMATAPEAVQAAAKKMFPKSTGLVVEKKTMIFYTVEAIVGDDETEVLLSGTGQLVEVESAVDEDSEQGESDEDDDDGDGKAGAGKHHESKGKAGKDDDDDNDDDDGGV